MKNRGILPYIAAAFLVLAGLCATTQYVRASPSSELGNVLSQIRFMGNIDFDNLVKWAKNGTPRPDDTTFQPQKTEADILNLGDSDRDAVLSWLRGNGRGALHAQGANDSDIGGQRPVDPKPAATPNPWRNIPLATATLDGSTQHGLQIIGGFAAVKKDGKSAIACLSFKNVDPRVATRIVFDFPLLGDGGQPLGNLTLDRTGTFSPNIDIHSYESMEQWQGKGVGPVRSFNEGCVQRDLPTAAIPFLQARSIGYSVVRVDYADGSSTAAPPPAAPQAPAASPAPQPS